MGAVRVNIRVKEEVREWYREQAGKYNLPYTNYISMILSKNFESEQDKKLIREFTEVVKHIKEVSGSVTVEEIMKELERINEIVNE